MSTAALHGIGVSRGIAIGKVHIIERDQNNITEYTLDENSITQEVARFKIAVSLARQQLRSIRDNIPLNTPGNISEFIDTHLLMLDDSTLTVDPIEIIKSKRCNAEWALKLQHDSLIQVFDEMQDPYLRTRKDDIDHVVSRIQRVLLNQGIQQHESPETHLKGWIILADDLSPADTIMLRHKGIASFITEHGGPTSHTAILAQSLNIPSIVGLGRALRYIHEGDPLIIDANEGVVLTNPDKKTLAHYQQRQLEHTRYKAELIRFKETPVVSKDNIHISLQANLELESDLDAVLNAGAAGIGLYRTEYLFMNRGSLPDEEEHYQTYTNIVASLKGRPLTIRTFDLGADKTVDHEHASSDYSTNPALGLRGIRLSLKRPRLFEPQLRAILRASAKGPVRILLPMLTNLQEVRQVLSIINEMKTEFSSKGIPFDPQLPIGGMIETPVAAVCADLFAQKLDFLSIGTNDLIQYSSAIDRANDEVNYLYDPLHPGLLRLIETTISAGQANQTPVAMCGEVAGNTRYIRLLLGLGLREFSVHPASLLEVKHLITETDISMIKPIAHNILHAPDKKQANELLERLNQSL